MHVALGAAVMTLIAYELYDAKSAHSPVTGSASDDRTVDWLTDPQIWASLVTLTALEIVLGIDNLVFVTILAGRLPAKRQNRARQLGLALALVTRLALLGSIAWIVGLTQPLFEVFGHTVSWRDLILMGGGLFLLY